MGRGRFFSAGDTGEKESCSSNTGDAAMCNKPFFPHWCFPLVLWILLSVGAFWQSNGLSCSASPAGHSCWSSAAEEEHEKVGTVPVRRPLRSNACLTAAARTAKIWEQAKLLSLGQQVSQFCLKIPCNQGKLIASQLLFTALRYVILLVEVCCPWCCFSLSFTKLYAGHVGLNSHLSCLWVTSVHQLQLIWENEIQGSAVFADFSWAVWFSTPHIKSREFAVFVTELPVLFCVFWIPSLYYLPDVPSQALNMSMFAHTRAHSLLQDGAPVTKDLLCVTRGSTGNWFTQLQFIQGFCDYFN